jgi:GNAT superfamily N-acetyltransferase
VAVVRVEEVVTHVEMTHPTRLRPARPVPGVWLDLTAPGSPLVRPLQNRIGAAHYWAGLTWSEEQWEGWLAEPRRRQWVVRSGAEPAGLAELEVQPAGTVEITAFGLLPEFIGRGIGGHALTLATRLAWRLEPVGDRAKPRAQSAEPARGGAKPVGMDRVRRVWLHTSSLDHPGALPNYRARGYVPFHTEVRWVELPP